MGRGRGQQGAGRGGASRGRGGASRGGAGRGRTVALREPAPGRGEGPGLAQGQRMGVWGLVRGLSRVGRGRGEGGPRRATRTARGSCLWLPLCPRVALRDRGCVYPDPEFAGANSLSGSQDPTSPECACEVQGSLPRDPLQVSPHAPGDRLLGTPQLPAPPQGSPAPHSGSPAPAPLTRVDAPILTSLLALLQIEQTQKWQQGAQSPAHGLNLLLKQGDGGPSVYFLRNVAGRCHIQNGTRTNPARRRTRCPHGHRAAPTVPLAGTGRVAQRPARGGRWSAQVHVV